MANMTKIMALAPIWLEPLYTGVTAAGSSATISTDDARFQTACVSCTMFGCLAWKAKSSARAGLPISSSIDETTPLKREQSSKTLPSLL